MQNMALKLSLIAVVLGVCLASIFFKELRLGKDLRGGVSLVYQVELARADDSQAVLTQVIEVLKERVDPRGIYDFSMQPVGRDRIEIVMALPNEKVRALQQAWETELDALAEEAEIPELLLDDALARGKAPEELGGAPGSERHVRISSLQEAHDAYRAAYAAYGEAKANAAPEAELLRLAAAAATAEIAFENMRSNVTALSLDEARIRRTLALPTEPVKLQATDADGNALVDPSQRETALGQLRTDFPHLADRIERVRVAWDAYQSERRGFDDPEDLMRLLRGAGVLEFHIAVDNTNPEGADIPALREELKEKGPDRIGSPAWWYPINELKQWYENADELAALEADPVAYFAGRRNLVAELHEGRHYLLLFTRDDRSMTHGVGESWSVTGAQSTVDQLGRPAVAFQLDQSAGAALMGRLTGGNIDRPMAIVLDGEVYSAPNIQSQITSSGQITGNFSQAEIQYLVRVLSAGSLQAKLSPEPISISVLGPSLGADNLARGERAFIISTIAVLVLMAGYYFLAGIVANIALIMNAVIVFGVMMLIDATFTLPGLAGVVLSIAMAVDANVLIYERMREAIYRGDSDLRGVVREGYSRALSAIVDGNMVHLVVCFVLFYTATTEVKGFAISLTIGVAATLFTALFVTRQIYYFYTDVFKFTRLPMLATVYPGIHRALQPSIDWIGKRPLFFTVSSILCLVSIVLVFARGADLFDTEFRGGVSITMETAVSGTDESRVPVRLLLRHTGSPDAVEERVRALGERAASATDPETATILGQLSHASVLTVGSPTMKDGVAWASEFQVKVASPAGVDDEKTMSRVIVDSIIAEFGETLDAEPSLSFAGANSQDPAPFVYPITRAELGEVVGRTELAVRAPAMRGGVAILVEDLSTPVAPESVARRVDRMRAQPDFQAYSGRRVEVYGITPAPGEPGRFTDLVVTVRDPQLVYDEQGSDLEHFQREVEDAEWRLVCAALTQPASLKQVTSFSSAIARTLAANAIVAVVMSLLGILLYIWVRFGSLRYSLATIVALIHNVILSLGLLAVTGLLGTNAITSAFLLEPFRIDLGVVAALLTIIGYSLNDTIVILDRIRENRGKLPLPTPAIVNASINQTFSRTILTGTTTFIALIVMYIQGGGGIRPFAFCLLAGLVIGTYSSVAIAAPLVLGRSADRPAEGAGALGAREHAALAARV